MIEISQSSYEETYVDESVASSITGLSVYKLRNDRHKSRGISYVKAGKSVRYALSDIYHYMQEHRVCLD